LEGEKVSQETYHFKKEVDHQQPLRRGGSKGKRRNSLRKKGSVLERKIEGCKAINGIKKKVSSSLPSKESSFLEKVLTFTQKRVSRRGNLIGGGTLSRTGTGGIVSLRRKR